MELSNSLNEKLINFMANYDNLDPFIIKAFKNMKRHYFLKKFYRFSGLGNFELITLNDENKSDYGIMDYIYTNHAIPTVLKEGHSVSSISQPSMNAHILKKMRLNELRQADYTPSILEIGSGTGWLMALIYETLERNALVIGLELISGLVEQSRETFARLDLDNLAVIKADGNKGYRQKAPYDRIVFTAASHNVSDFVMDQLKQGGLVLLPLITPSWNLFTVLKRTEWGLMSIELSLASFVTLRGSEKEKAGLTMQSVNLNKLSHIKMTRKISLDEILPTNKIKEANLKLFVYLADRRACNFIRDHNMPSVWNEEGFGLYDPKSDSYCLYKNKHIYLFGDNGKLLDSFILILKKYIKLHMPSLDKMQLYILEKGKVMPDIPQDKILSKTDIRDNTYIWFSS
jgi:protein-L-isoaspartate(D-aspartate) O-methyltransferase